LQSRSDQPVRRCMSCGVTESFTGALFARSETVLPAEPIENFHLGALDRALARFQASAGEREWGICTECGMWRVAAGDVPRLLDLHHEILEAQPQVA
jgi:hypothetical protein